MLVVNNDSDTGRAEIVWEKGTNRAAFYRGEVDKYGWVDIGSSFLPSELTTAFLLGQLEMIEEIQMKRKNIFNRYFSNLLPLQVQGNLRLPFVPDYAGSNGHLFFVVTNDLQERDRLIQYLVRKGIQAVFHYLPLHRSAFFTTKHDGRELMNAVRYAETLIRLPFYYDLSEDDLDKVCEAIQEFYGK
jgi:dTDP-4-amino-4,6-dideoxygalactose transaminase